VRLVYGAPPDQQRWSRERNATGWPEELAKTLRIEREKRELGKALYNLIAPLAGEEPLP
jgi:hypothetical protein